MALAGLVLLFLGAGLAPLFLRPPRWHEERAIRQILSRHPTLRLVSLETLDAPRAAKELRLADPADRTPAPWGFLLKLSWKGEVSELSRFRKALKNDPRLARTTATFIFNGCHNVAGAPPDPELQFLVVSTRN
jgi:hypothetical protein